MERRTGLAVHELINACEEEVMERRTGLAVHELINACEDGLQDGCQSHCCDSGPPACFFINELGVCAIDNNDRTAQKYLLGLLSHSNEGYRYLALIYLLQAKDLEAGDKVALDSFKDKRKNMPLVQQAYTAIREYNASKMN